MYHIVVFQSIAKEFLELNKGEKYLEHVKKLYKEGKLQIGDSSQNKLNFIYKRKEAKLLFFKYFEFLNSFWVLISL